MNLRSILYVSVIVLLAFSCKKENTAQSIKVAPITFTHEGNLQLLDSTQTIKQNLKIEIADNDYEHQTGLMHRKTMDDRQAMLFVFNDDDIRIRSFYMKNTYISLDLIFIDADHKIINIAKNAEPLNETPILSDAPAKYVLEINAGLSDKWDLQSGDRIQFERLEK